MVISTTGDLGDMVMLCGVIAEIPAGPHTLILMTDGQTKIRTEADLQRFAELVIPLAKSQSYITECRIICGGDQIGWRSQDFRGKGKWCPEVTLLGAHAHNLQTTKGIKVDHGTKRWLHNITPNPYGKNRVIVNRTGRYRNPHFPWQQIVNHYGDRLLFVGTPAEYRDLCGEFGAIEFFKTENLLQVAELIEASALFIGNQSSANAICEGLKHDLIQETCLTIPDCIFRRPNAQHVADGACILPDVDGSGVLTIGPINKDRYIFRTHMTPPDGWQFRGKRQTAWNAIIAEVKRLPEFRGMDEAELEKQVMAENWERKPDFFGDASFQHRFHTFNSAMEHAPVG